MSPEKGRLSSFPVWRHGGYAHARKRLKYNVQIFRPKLWCISTAIKSIVLADE